MGNYPVFSPAQPNIDVNLFGNAAKTGALLGQEIPSTFTSVTQGAIQGYQTGQDISLKNAQIDAAEARADIAQSQAKIQSATEDTQIIATKDILAVQADKAQGQLDASKSEDQYYNDSQNLAPAELADNVLKGTYSRFFSANPHAFNQALGEMYADPGKYGLGTDTANRIGQELKIRSAVNYRQQQAEKDVPKFDGVKEELGNQSYIGQAVRRLGMTKEEAMDDIELVPPDQYLIENNHVVEDTEGPPGQQNWKTNPKFNPDAKLGRYLAISKSTGIVVDGTGSLGNKQFDLQNRYYTLKGSVNGAFLHKDLDNIRTQGTPKPAPSTASTKVPLPTFAQSLETARSEFAGHTPGTPEDKVGEELATLTHVNPVSLTMNAGGSLFAFRSQVDQYVKSPEKRGSPEFQVQRAQTVRNISRAITDTQFKNSPAIQAQNTQSHVDEYNRLFDIQHSGLNFMATTGGVSNSVLDAFKPVTGEDLYFIGQAPVIQKSINAYFDSLVKDLESKHNAVPNGKRASNATINFMAGQAQRGPS